MNQHTKSIAYIVQLKLLAEAFEVLEHVLNISENNDAEFKAFLDETNADSKTYFFELRKELAETDQSFYYLHERMKYLKERLDRKIENENKKSI
jgi:hypothetical protein